MWRNQTLTQPLVLVNSKTYYQKRTGEFNVLSDLNMNFYQVRNGGGRLVITIIMPLKVGYYRSVVAIPSIW